MSHRAILILPLLVLALSVCCQDRQMDKKQADKDAPADYYRRVLFELDPLKDRILLPFPVNTIHVLDIRQDTTKFGYYGPGSIIAPFKQFCFANGAAADIAAFLNSSFTPASPQPGQKLLYCLKKLWITNTDSIDENFHRTASSNSKLYIKAELFFEKDSLCYPLYRFDSVFAYSKTAGNVSVKWVKEALVTSLQKLQGLTPEKVVKRNALKRSEIDGYYADEKRAPINSIDSPAKGVYLTVDQFKNNRPAFTDFEVSYEKVVDIMRIKDAEGNYTVFKKDWGYCDGRYFYMRIGQNYFRLFKTGDTYELNGADLVEISKRYPPTTYTTPDGHIMPGYSRGPTGAGLGRLKPLQLDMETGRAY